MIFFNNAILLLLAVTATTSNAMSNMDVVMRGGDPPLMGLDEGSFPTYRNGSCVIRFSRNGNWATQNGFYTGGFDANQNSYCSAEGSLATYKLQEDGNFVAYCGSILDYATHTAQGTIGDYLLAIDDDCMLHLMEGTWDCDSINLGAEIWTNIRKEPLRNGNKLGKGEQVRHAGTTLVMQSSDGNLVLYDGVATDDTVLWAANAMPPSNAHDYYAKVTNNGYLQLVGIGYQYGQEAVYFSEYLDVPTNTTCFTVEYDGVDSLVGVPCE